MINTGIELLNGEQALLTLYIQGAMLYFVSPTLVALTIVYTIRRFRDRKKQKDTKDKNMISKNESIIYTNLILA